MTIKIYSDRIDIGDFTLFEGNGGVQFDGVARAENFRGGVGTFQGSISGYLSGGFVNTIEKFPFATNSNATDVGDLLTVATETSYYESSTASSKTHGYLAGGQIGPNIVNTIQKFPFATDTNSTDVGDLTVAKNATAGQSSTAFGYVCAGNSGVHTNTIEKFPFSADSNGTDVGDLLAVNFASFGTQD